MANKKAVAKKKAVTEKPKAAPKAAALKEVFEIQNAHGIVSVQAKNGRVTVVCSRGVNVGRTSIIEADVSKPLKITVSQ